MSQPKLTELRNYLLNRLGLKFTDNQEKELYNKVKAASKSFSFDNTGNFINWLIKQELDTEQTEKLASFLTIGETYFFREKKALDYLEFEYLPKLINKRRGKNQQLRIWSAGCASGEEPYSVAILLKRILPDIKNWDITILATDINPEFIKKAKKGIYTKWSFRGISESFKTMNFKKLEDNKYHIKSSIKKMVDFSFVNLASDSYPSSTNNTNEIDIILCRNVLIYFSIEGIKSVTSKFYNSLNDNGVLLVSPVESSNLISSKFYQFSNNGITVYLKDAKAALKQKAKHAKIIPIKITDKPKSSVSLKPATKHIEKLRTKPLSKIDVKSEKKLVKVSKETHSEKETNEPSDYQKALDFYKSGLFDKSEELILKTASNNNKKNNILLARIKANKGQLEESEKLCLQAIKLDKIDAEAHYLLATVFSEQGKIDEAINSINKTLFLEPDFALGHFFLGNISMNVKNKNESKKHFSNALKSLDKLKPDEIIAESDGLTAGRLVEIINSLK